MKNKLTVSALILASLIATVGCVTTNPSGPATPSIIYVDSQGLLVVEGVVIDPSTVGQTIGLATTIGAAQAVQSDIHATQYLQAAKQLIDASLATGNYDPAALQNALNSISINELKNNATVKAIIVTSINAYARYYGAVVAQNLGDTSPYLKPILQGISNGIGAVVSPSIKPKSKVYGHTHKK
jgi:hypothetical protein